MLFDEEANLSWSTLPLWNALASTGEEGRRIIILDQWKWDGRDGVPCWSESISRRGDTHNCVLLCVLQVAARTPHVFSAMRSFKEQDGVVAKNQQ